MRVVARAGANIALIKYWGKRDESLNLPAAGSLALTLAELETVAEVEFLEGPGVDEVEVDGERAADAVAWRVSQFLDLIRRRAGREERARVSTRNSFPTGAGLASSASAFAALALAAVRAAGLAIESAGLSALARQGSGSAARSIFGGFVEMNRGDRADGRDAVAHCVAPPDHWNLRLVIALTAEGRKELGSTEAMIRTAETSPLYDGWLASVPPALETARTAVQNRDLHALGEVMEHSALTMHGSALAARPPILYWNAATVAVLHRVREVRRQGCSAFFTIDAGPNVKVLCEERDAALVDDAMRDVPGVLRTLVASPGLGAQVCEEAA